MEKSDIFIYNGAGMEQWVDDVLESLDTEELTSVEASKGIKLLKRSGCTRTRSRTQQ